MGYQDPSDRPGGNWIAVRPGIIVTAPTYTVPTEYEVIGCDCTANAIAITLPISSAFKGRQITVKKIDATGPAVTVTPQGTELIDRVASMTLTAPDTSLTFYARPDGRGWWVI